MRALDRHTIEEWGVPGEVLMESAGRSVVELLLDRFAADLAGEGAEVAVICAGGGNGGDGLVVARHLHGLGVPTRALLWVERGDLAGDAASQYSRALAAGVQIEGPEGRLPRAGLIVDALFGTGLSRGLEGEIGKCVEAINAASASGSVRVLSIDLPSGLDADTGQVLGVSVRADATVTMGSPKIGLALEPGRSAAGEIWVARIGIADRLPDDDALDPAGEARMWSRRSAAEALPARPAAGHKGRFGHALIVAGSEGKTGAAALTARSTQRAGGGLVTVGCPAGLNDILEGLCLEMMTVGLPEEDGRQLAEAGLETLLDLAAEMDVVAIGPGVGRSPGTVALMHGLAERVSLPLVIDADGLNAFEGCVERLQSRSAPTLLTPHPGEAARLLGDSAARINRDRVGAARALAEQSGAVVLLKGPGSVVAGAAGRVFLNPTGGPNLASAGSGDVLSGIVTGLMAQGLMAAQAAALGAYLHGLAGDSLAQRLGDGGLLAHELADELPKVMRQLREEGGQGGAGGNYDRSTLLAFPDA
jgi:NAD(P)H-hydrate epimerase